MIKRLLKCVREFRLPAILTPILVIAEVVLEVAIPFVLARLIDMGIDVGNMDMVRHYGVILVGLALVSLFFGVAAGRTSAVAAAGFARNLRHDMYENVQNYAFSNIDRFSTASIVTRLTTDITNVQMAFQMSIRVAVRGPLMLVSSLIMAFILSPKLALIFLAVIPLLFAGLLAIIRVVHPIFERIFKTYDRLNNVVQENLRGVRVVKAFVRQEYEIEKFDNVSGQIFRDFSKAERIMAFNAPLMQLAMYSTIIFLSWFGARLIVVGQLSTGELMSLISYAGQILMSLMMLSMIFVMIIISQASAERIVEILEEKGDLRSPEHPKTEVADGSIVFQDVQFSYSNDGDKCCLKDINLSIASGETIGIIGATGSGKSSLVQLIPRLYDVYAGRVLVGGADVRAYDLDALRSAVAMVLQKNVLFSGTIRENLRWGDADATDEELEEACRLAQADEFIRNLPQGYDTLLNQGGSNLSGGQRQRLCIARALVKKPKILILDDSTSAVDTKTDALIRQAFLEKIPNTTKLIIAQRISSIEGADRIIVLEDGRIDAIGTHEQLLKENEIYREVYESQHKGGDFDAA